MSLRRDALPRVQFPKPAAMSKIYFVAGEASGDNHGAALMESLRRLQPDVRLSGRGGPQMKEIAGDRSDALAFVEDQSNRLGFEVVIEPPA